MKNSFKHKFRKALNLSTENYLLHVSDILSAPNFKQYLLDGTREKSALPHYHASRALTFAEESDCVVLAAPLNEEYHSWLRSVGLSTDHVFSYNLLETSQSLAEIIKNDPEPLKKYLSLLPGKPVYLPFYASDADYDVATNVLACKFYGSREEVALKYFDKLEFKKCCIELGLPVVEGSSVNISSNSNKKNLESFVSNLLHNYGKLILRGTLSSAGGSLFTIENSDLSELYNQLRNNPDNEFLVEPLLNVISSPNDQWLITLDGKIEHLSLTAQLFQGLKHAGNIHGQYYSDRIQDYIFQTSQKIVQQMATLGYRGILGIDYIVTENEIYPIENNARMNGSTFVHAIAEQIEKKVGTIPCWKFYKATTENCTVSELFEKLSDILYDGQKINSVFPYDCDSLAENGSLVIIIFAEDVFHIDYFQDILFQRGIFRR